MFILLYLLVYCPVESFEEVENQLEYTETMTSLRTRFARTIARNDDMGNDPKCLGSLIIIHAPENNLDDPQTIRLGGHRTEYSNMKRGFPELRNNVILNVEAFGCECWEIFERPQFAGAKEIVFPGEPHHLSMEMGSILKVKCDEEYYDYYSVDYEGK